MEPIDCYRILGLTATATLEDVKASYRRLARLYHPDLNPGLSHEKFVELHEAYQRLLKVSRSTSVKTATAPPPPQPPKPPPPPPPQPKRRKSATFQHHPDLSEAERELKCQAYYRLQRLLRLRKFPHAIALVEGLTQRIPDDREVRQWQAVTYQRFAHYCIDRRALEKARIYLKKSLRIDPHNRALWLEVERDFVRLEKLMGQQRE
ncbi:MAG: J domain-containing protein [Cyanobacteria bacterium SID2]|nr:J domain-containing protein [Cyanobacteria bacterium SID2]MBP0005792.1 J domain-containing protein [Cyanobacteria bacterium SBC]